VKNSDVTFSTRELFTERKKLTSLQFDDIDMLEKWPFGPENVELTSLVFTYIHPTDQNHKMVYREGVANKKEQEMIRNPGEYDPAIRAEVHSRTLRSPMQIDDVRDPAQKCLDTRDDSTEDPIIHETNLIFLDK
jgi:PhoPQ-activated pathogenicity-related protein